MANRFFQKKSFVRLLYMSLFLCFQNQNLIAQCDCVLHAIEIEEQLATEIFIGRVLAKEINNTDIDGVDPDLKGLLGGIRNTIEVQRVIKGNILIGDTIQILTGDINNACGYSFELNQFYLIYSRYLFTDHCRRTRRIETQYDNEIKNLLRDSSVLTLGAPLLSRDNSSLTESNYLRIRQPNSLIIPRECEWSEDRSNCIKRMSNRLSSYFYKEISERAIKQIIVLHVKPENEVFISRIVPRIGELEDDEKSLLLNYIRDNLAFVTAGYGEVMNEGLVHLLLENRN